MIKMMKKWTAAAALALFFSAGAAFFSMGADGIWIQDGQNWQYRRPDGSMARGSWEDIDGEWYYFDHDTYMATGWRKVGNLRYCFEENGALAEGFRHDTEDGEDKWYYYDQNGNVAIHWQNIGGKWYWFNSSGVLNAEPAKTIDGLKFYFHEDGSMVCNEYIGFQYINMDGQPDSQYNIQAESQDGGKISVDESVKDEIAERINALPAGWRKKFADDGYVFVYCPEKEYFSASKNRETGEWYHIKYKLSTTDQYIRFTEPEAVWGGFGEYMYRNVREWLRDYDFSWEVRHENYEIVEMTGIPESLHEDYQVVFGILFSRYLNEDWRPEMEEKLEDICWIFDKVTALRNPDGTLVEK